MVGHPRKVAERVGMIQFLPSGRVTGGKAINFGLVEIAEFQEKRGSQPDRLVIRFHSGRVEWFPMKGDQASDLLAKWLEWSEGDTRVEVRE